MLIFLKKEVCYNAFISYNKELSLLKKLDEELVALLDKKHFESPDFTFDVFNRKAHNYIAYLNDFIIAYPLVNLQNEGIHFVLDSQVNNKLYALKNQHRLFLNYQSQLQNQPQEEAIENHPEDSDQESKKDFSPGLFSHNITLRDRDLFMIIDEVNVESRSTFFSRIDEAVTVRLRVKASVAGEYHLILYQDEQNGESYSSHSFYVLLGNEFKDIVLRMKPRLEHRPPYNPRTVNFKNIFIDFTNPSLPHQGLTFRYHVMSKHGSFRPFR